MIDLRFRPLTRWLGPRTPSSSRKRGSFRASYNDTLNLLESNLEHLAATGATIEAAFRDNQIRNDGWPFSAASPSEPGVILSFQSKYGPLALPCDCLREWQSNLRAIAFHLEHLRLSTIYGVGSRGEQYKGWLALPEPGGENSLDHFAQLMIQFSQLNHTQPHQLLADYDTFRAVYRAAARHVHPDHAVSNDAWNKLQEAEHMIHQNFKAKGVAS